ncbi:hypothetical protein JTT01_05695 [Clostridium botulinum]|nr:hypothetical protein [Clostridium botulinum]
MDSKENVLKVIEGKKNWCDEKGYSNISELNIDVENNIIKYIKVESFAEYIGIGSLKTYKKSILISLIKIIIIKLTMTLILFYSFMHISIIFS